MIKPTVNDDIYEKYMRWSPKITQKIEGNQKIMWKNIPVDERVRPEEQASRSVFLLSSSSKRSVGNFEVSLLFGMYSILVELQKHPVI